MSTDALECGRPQGSEELCGDCAKWEANPLTRSLLRQNRSVYLYNTFMKEVLARFKFRGDAELVFAFAPSFISAFQQYFRRSPSVLVPIPLSEERKAERGFNQAERLASLLQIPVIHPKRLALSSTTILMLLSWILICRMWAAPISGSQSLVSGFRQKVIFEAEGRIIKAADTIFCTSLSRGFN